MYIQYSKQSEKDLKTLLNTCIGRTENYLDFLFVLASTVMYNAEQMLGILFSEGKLYEIVQYANKTPTAQIQNGGFKWTRTAKMIRHQVRSLCLLFQCSI